jgi:hypothetical protein
MGGNANQDRWPRRWLLGAVLAALLCLTGAGGALAAISPANASAGTTTCTGTISSGVDNQSLTIEGDVVVPAGATCLLLNIKIDGNLTVDAGATFFFSIRAIGPIGGLNGVSGNVRAIRAAGLGINFAQIGGSVTAVGTSGEVGLYRTGVAKNLILIGNDSLFFHSVGVGGAASCENNGTVLSFYFFAAHPSGQCRGLLP